MPKWTVSQPDSTGLLVVWEQGYNLSPGQQAILLLSLACPNARPEEIDSLHPGERDNLLFHLREALFGDTINGLSNCPRCQARVEIQFRSRDLRAALDQNAEVAGEDRTFSFAIDGYEIQFRLPTIRQITEFRPVPEADAHSELAVEALLKTCILSARCDQDGKQVDISASNLPRKVLDLLEQRMGEMDPFAELSVGMKCPNCGLIWQASFDIGAFLWNEVDARARHTLREVHELASAYGWREADILNLSPRRRQIYLEMIRP